jgi:hypothetical protein
MASSTIHSERLQGKHVSRLSVAFILFSACSHLFLVFCVYSVPVRSLASLSQASHLTFREEGRQGAQTKLKTDRVVVLLAKHKKNLSTIKQHFFGYYSACVETCTPTVIAI